MYEDVVQRLQSLGYTVLDTDQWLINFTIEKVTWTIKNECNVSSIPDGLHNIAVDMVCGEFLSAKKGSGQLTEYDVEEVIKSIKEGDTTITYAIGDGAVTLDRLINYLINCGKSQFVTYRRFVW